MNILTLSFEFPPHVVGGLGVYNYEITKELISQGHSVTVYTPNTGNDIPHEIMDGVKVHRLFMMNIPKGFYSNWDLSNNFINDVMKYNYTMFEYYKECQEEEEYDIVIAHDWLSAIAGINIKQYNPEIKYIQYYHSTEWGRSLGNGYDEIVKLEKYAGTQADRIVTVSHPMKADLIDNGFEGDKISVLHNGVDIEKYSTKNVKGNINTIRDKCEVAPDEKMVLFVGRLTAVKGIIEFVKAIPEVLNKYPDTQFVILGTGELQDEIEKLRNELDIQDNLKCRFEFVNETKRINCYAASDIVVLPSKYEPFGIVSLEAMSLTKPIIVGSEGVCGFRDQVEHKIHGLYCNGNDAHSIAEQIIFLLDDEYRATWIAIRARDRVLRYFTWKKVTEQAIDIYKEVIKEKDE